jgi:cell division septation protein DedD
MATTESPPAVECPRCGTPVAAGQEYCLECGARLPDTAPPSGWPEDPQAGPGWVWPVLVTLVVAILSAGVVVAAQLTKDDDEPLLVATTETPALPTPTQTAPEPPPTTAPPVTTAPAPTTAPTTPQPGRLVQWPAAKNGYTLVLASVPEPSGRARATAIARKAREAGLAQVGVLRSSRYGSLHPGYYVVFSGIFDTAADAARGMAAVERAGYDAYVRPISS